MRMQNWTLMKRALASACLSFAAFAYAGDPIRISGGDKNKSVPNEAREVERDAFKSWNKNKAPGSPLNSLTPFVGPQMIDPKEERRLKSVQDEKKNWMLLEPGELQRRD